MPTSLIAAIIGEELAVAALLQRMLLRILPAVIVVTVPGVAQLSEEITPTIAFVRASSYRPEGMVELAELRRRLPAAFLIAITVFAEAVAADALAAGADAVLEKPFDAAALRSTLQTAPFAANQQLI